MNRLFAFPLATLLCCPAVTAQDEDADFNLRQAKKLADFAKRTFDKGFPRQAKLIWLQVIKLYDPDNQDAHKGLGHVRQGTAWNPDPNFTYPTADTGSGNDAQQLASAYENLGRELARGHEQMADKWAQAGNAARAHEHWQLVLRWVKNHAKAQAALEHREVGDVTGSKLEQTLFERSKTIEKAVADQSRVDYKVEKAEGAKNAVLDHAQVKYTSVKSEHFTLHGDPAEEQNLIEALKWAERCLRVCEVAFPWKVDFADYSVEWAYFADSEDYHQVLKAHADKISDVQWRIDNGVSAFLDNTAMSATPGPQTLFDACVRNVAKAWAGFRSDGFSEGIGHTFVGQIFKNNRLFAVDLKKQEGTAASEEDRRYTSPDFDVWKDLALEAAWSRTGGIPARDLPFCDAATFTNEQRIKAWSFCDYVMRRDPELLRDMDQLALQMQAKKQKQPLEYERLFDEAHQDAKIATLDKEWADFWTEGSPVMKAIQNNTPPLAAVSKGVEKWLEAFNAARTEKNATTVTWGSTLSTRCHDHAIYLKNNKDERGPEKEHRQLVELGGTHLGSMFAQSAIVEFGASVGGAKKMFQRWMEIPGYRDALLNNYILSIGLYTEGDILVMNVTSAIGAPKNKSQRGYKMWPAPNSTGIPVDVETKYIGPELMALLAKNGRPDQKTVGYPLTIHFASNIPGDRNTYACTVVTEGKESKDIKGAILLDGGKIRRTTAPGMVTFYPFDELPHGKLQAVWTWQQDGEQKRERVEFTTK